LTLDEKILQMQKGGAAANSPAPAIERLGINPWIWGSECVTGLGSDDTGFYGTSFPQPLGMAASFDRELFLSVTTVISDELRAQNNVDLANKVYKYHHGISCW
jgi:beta-glucosidase